MPYFQLQSCFVFLLLSYLSDVNDISFNSYDPGNVTSRAFIRNDVNMLLAVTVLHSVWPGNRKHGQRELFSEMTWAGVAGSKRAKLSRWCHQGHLHRFAWWGVSRRYRTTQQFSLTLALVMGVNFCLAQDALKLEMMICLLFPREHDPSLSCLDDAVQLKEKPHSRWTPGCSCGYFTGRYVCVGVVGSAKLTWQGVRSLGLEPGVPTR